MTPDQFQALMKTTNELAGTWKGPMGDFQGLRRNLKGATRAKALFGPTNIKSDYAFHWGGRNEFQLSTGLEEEGTAIRVGLAFSLETSDKTRGVFENLQPKVAQFNALATTAPSLLSAIDQAYWVPTKTKNKDHHPFKPGVIPDVAIHENVFIFLGQFFPTESIKPETLLDYWDKLIPLYEAVEQGIAIGGSGKPHANQKAWALFSNQDGDQSFQGNDGYEDRLGEYLSFDNQVANSFQVKKGDRILIIDGSFVYGTSIVDRIKSGPATKTMKVCPDCGTTTLSARKTLPGFKCTKCKKVSKEPQAISKDVTAFRAYYAPQWEPFEPPLPRNTFAIPFMNKAVQNAIRPLDGDQLSLLLGNPTPGEEVEREIEELLGKPRKGRGFAPGLNAAQKKAIENRAMEVAQTALEAKGWLVSNKSLGNPYDLRALRSGIEMHVEVKGTITTGEKVVLTRGEVKHHGNTDVVSALYIVSGIELKGTKDAPEARNGTLRIICPWRIDPAHLDALAYEYSVPTGLKFND